MKTADLCRKHGISEASFYNWKAKYGGLEVSEAKRLKGLVSENAKLKRLLAAAMVVIMLVARREHTLNWYDRRGEAVAVPGGQCQILAPTLLRQPGVHFCRVGGRRIGLCKDDRSLRP
jgi:hypothetical protein